MIEVYALTRRYGSVTAVDDLTFEVQPGRITGFLGPNGSGKSTTMRTILGLDAPSSGETYVNDTPYAKLHRPLRQIGALLDANAVHGGRSAFQHLLCLAQSNRIGRSRVTEVLELVGLASAARRRVGGFSLGMKQRLGIAAALLGDPPVLMFDEPINGLDPEGVRWLRELLRSLSGEGRTVFLSSHLMSEMAVTADHLIVIGRGRLIADTSMAELTTNGSRRDVLVRSSRETELAALLETHGAVTMVEPGGGLAVTGLDAPAIAELATAHHLPIHELSSRNASLEEAYMELTADSVEYQTTACSTTRKKD